MRFIKYSIKNIEPLRIANDSTSQSGHTMCCRYIPGTTMRGYIVNRLAMTDVADFETYKKELFSDEVSFMNAYPVDAGRALIPTPKGFYEKKQADGFVQNVVISGDFDEGMKRASMGRFAAIEKDTILYYNVEMGSDLKIKINDGDQNVFRNEYIASGHTFTGYIGLDDKIGSDVEDRIIKVLSDDSIILGNGRSQGLGKCKLVEDVSVVDEMAYHDGIAWGDVSDSVYMILLSDTVMRNAQGEYCGLSLDELARSLDVTNMAIENCSTSTITVRGYNSIWGTHIPAINMYEMGSCFKLSFKGIISKEKLRQVENKGIGVRRNEGFGRVIFVGTEYENINKKVSKELSFGIQKSAIPLTTEDKAVLKIVARNIYRKRIKDAIRQGIIDHRLNVSIPKSQIGSVRALLEINKYNPKIVDELKNVFEHSSKKETEQKVQKSKVSSEGFHGTIMGFLESSLTDILGIDSSISILGYSPDELIGSEEMRNMKVDFILELISYNNREGK